MTAPREHPSTPTHWRRYLRQSLGFWLLLVGFVPAVMAVVVPTLGRATHTVAPKMIRWWGRIMLRIVGIRLVLEPPVIAELARRRRRVLTFNHFSTMDMFVMTALWPDGTVAVVKRELMWVPLMGTALYFLDFLPLNRGNHAKATASLHAAAARVRRRDLTLMIAPEGTRSKSGELQRFKLGAFHLAAEADAPLVPLALHGTLQLWPRWQRHCNPGVVTVRLLPEQPSGHDDASPAAIHARAAALHALYAEALAEMARTIPVT